MTGRLLPDAPPPEPPGGACVPATGIAASPLDEGACAAWMRGRNPSDEMGVPYAAGLASFVRARGEGGTPRGMVVVSAAGEGPGRIAARRLLSWRPDAVLAGAESLRRSAGAASVVVALPWDAPALEEVLVRAAARIPSTPAPEIRVLGRHPLAGEPTAALEALDGALAVPRLKPTDTFLVGARGAPAWVWGPEPLARAGRVAMGETEPETPHRLVTVLGGVAAPGVYDRPEGIALDALVRDAGERPWTACLVGGMGGEVLLPGDRGEALTEAVWRRVAGPRSEAVVIVLPKDGCVADWTLSIARFFLRASCGQCPPCRDGTNRIAGLVREVERGARGREHLLVLERLAGWMRGQGNCPVAGDLSRAAGGLARRLAPDWVGHLQRGGCPPAPV